ncbi:MAG: hypothetical protein M1G31_20010 [Pseudanabaena sp. Salubria-1]|nr:hypothetical protein [Pseudanabaena sp. Salubria-1]
MKNKAIGIAMLTFLACAQVQIVTSESIQAQTTQDRQAEADRLLERGNQLNKISQFREALQVFEKSLQIYREIKNLGSSGFEGINV